jgi:hypothetical protein
VFCVSAHAHSNTITLKCVNITLDLMSPLSTDLRNAIDVEVSEGSVSESRRRRGQGREEHRLSLHSGR